MLHRARLDQRIQRHDIEAAEQTNAEDRAENPPGLANAQHRQPVMRHRRFGEAAREPPEQNAEQGQADGAERHQADFHLVPTHALAEHRAQRDTDREHGKNQRDHAFIAVQPLFGIGRNLRQVYRAEKPEPRVTDHRTRHGRALTQAKLHRRPGLTQDVPVQFELRHGRRGGRNTPAGQIAEYRHQHHSHCNDMCISTAGHDDAGANGAGEDGQESTHLH